MTYKVRTRFRRKNGRQIRKDVDENGALALQFAGALVADAMVDATPRVTGRAQGSITWATSRARSRVKPPATVQDEIEAPLQPNVVKIGSALWRFKFLEFGTLRHAARAILRGTFEKMRTPIRRVFVGQYNAAIDRAE